MRNNILEFFQLQRQTFGMCPKCDSFIRLSDCQIFLKEKRNLDWLDELQKREEKIERSEERLEQKKLELQEKAREKGRKLALKLVKKLDPIFTPRGLDPDDARVLFHPIDYVVFDGMKGGDVIKEIVLLDRERKDTSSRRLQKSIEKVIDSGNYEWQTIVIDDYGKIKCK